MPDEQVQHAVLGAGVDQEAYGIARDLGEARPARLDHQGRGRNGIGRRDGDAGRTAGAAALMGRHDFFMSRWVATIISIIRFQTFSMKAIIRLSSASLGNDTRGSSTLVPGGS